MVPYTSFSAHPEDMRWGLKASSILDAMLCPDSATRYHTFMPERFPGVDVGVLDHGSGDSLMCFLDTNNGCLIKGFDHESPMSPHAQEEFRTWDGIFDEAPGELLAHLEDPEFCKAETTFCIWRGKGDKNWWQGSLTEPEDGETSDMLLDHVFVNAQSYFKWAREYYSNPAISKGVVEEVFDSCQASEAATLAINPTADLEAVRRELAPIGVSLA